MLPQAVDDELLAHLTPAERAELDVLLEAQFGATHLRDFVPLYTPALAPLPRQMSLIGDLVHEAHHRRLKVCFSMPPRHGKTFSFVNALVAWMLDSPADTHAYLSYSDSQARSKSAQVRKLARRAGVALDRLIASTREWRTLEGGGLLAGGVGGGLTGQGISGLAVIDDPLKNRIEADSKARRDAVWNWLMEVVYTRQEGCSYFLIHTRWHEDDPIGRLEALGDWLVINVPAIAEADDPLGRAPGEALWPERFPVELLEEIRRTIGEWSFAALYQGHPRPRGAKIFGEPSRYSLAQWRDTHWQRRPLRAILSCDPAATAKTQANHSAAMLIAAEGYGLMQHGWIADYFADQITVPELVRRLATTRDRWGGRVPVGVEAVGAFKGVADALRELDPSLPVIEITPLGDKFTRAQPASAAWNNGKLLVPFDTGWAEPLIKVVREFTGVGDARDDDVDAMSHGWNELFRSLPPAERRVRPAVRLHFG